MGSSDAGYVYVLMNPSLEGMVKVGKTSRSAEERAKELSQATGVPTPFIVVYKKYCKHCSKVEQKVHALLAAEGYRVSSNREFFNAPVPDVIEAVISATKQEKHENVVAHDESVQALINESDDFSPLLQKAKQYQLGLNGYLVDLDQAFDLYKKAAIYGSSEAYRQLAIISESGVGSKYNTKKALEYYEKGLEQGNPLCFIGLASHYIIYNEELAEKYLSRFLSEFDMLSLPEGVSAAEIEGAIQECYILLKQINPNLIWTEQFLKYIDFLRPYFENSILKLLTECDRYSCNKARLLGQEIQELEEKSKDEHRLLSDNIRINRYHAVFKYSARVYPDEYFEENMEENLELLGMFVRKVEEIYRHMKLPESIPDPINSDNIRRYLHIWV